MSEYSIIKKLIVDDYSELFDTDEMEYREYASEFEKVRDITRELIAHAPDEFLDGYLLEQQISEIIKNAIKHGNQKDPAKKIRVWFSFRKRVRLIVEDEGEGFKNLDAWNLFFKERQLALLNNDFDKFLSLASYRGPASDDSDGGNSLISALEYWNGGIIYSESRNKVGVIRWYSGGSKVKSPDSN